MPNKRKGHTVEPMDEENFPDNPTRRSADKHMAEPTNTPGSNPDVSKEPLPVTEDDE